MVGQLFVQAAFTKTKQLLVFKKTASLASVTISVEEVKIFYFKVKKNTGMEIFFDEKDIGLKFVLFKANGKPFYDARSVDTEMRLYLMDILSDARVNQFSVKVPENLRNQAKPIKFTLRLVLR